MEFKARLDLSARVPVDDLTLCIVTGNLLEKHPGSMPPPTGPASSRPGGRPPMMLVENSYNRQIKKNGSRILSSKRDGGLGILSIKRILNQPGDEFDVDYDTTFTAMVKIVDRAMAWMYFSAHSAQDKIKMDCNLPETMYNGSCQINGSSLKWAESKLFMLRPIT